MNVRDQVISEAIELVGDNGVVRDYQCDCAPGGERFLVMWNIDSGVRLPVCFNIEQLRLECQKQ